MTQRTVLALDLSTPHGAIAVLRGDAVLFEAGFTSERSHNAQVFAPLGAALKAAGRGRGLLVIGTGPGSYTGVRIAIAAAQGVALSRGWEVIGWPSITTATADEYLVIGDARRGLFYVAQIAKGALEGKIELLDAGAALARVEAVGSWVSFDAKAPLGLSCVTLARPNANTLARIAAALPEAEIQRRAGLPLEPVYLQDAFITTAKKAGKLVPEQAS